jgi:hypothetical protein
MRDQCPAGEQYAIFGKDAVKSVSIFSKGYVRFGSKADICVAKSHVRFAPESGQRALEIMGAYDLVFIY